MKVQKFLVSLFMGTLFVVLGSGVTMAASFTDVPEYNLFSVAVSYLEDEGIVVGYEDETYGVGTNINRAEFLKIVMEASDYEVEGGDCFPDVADQWFAPYVCKAYEVGLVDGYPDGTFKPGREINFAEASKIVVNTLGVDMADFAEDNWFQPYVLALEEQDAIPGVIDNFDRELTRGDMAEMTWRIMNGRTYKVSNTYENIQANKPAPELGGELVPFDSCVELVDYFEDNADSYDYYYDDFMFEETMAAAPMMEKAADGESGAGVGEYAEDYSATNIQVEGVDEADIVKNDGKYIYYLRGDTVRVIDAYPPGQMEELDRVTFADSGFYPYEMYVDEDRLVVVGDSYGDIFYDYRYDYYGGSADVYIFDITDKSNIELLREVSFEGGYLSSRKIGDTVYLVVNQYNYYVPYEEDGWEEVDLVPLYSDNGDVGMAVTCGEVRYMPGVMDSVDYMIVAAIPVDDLTKDISKEVVLGAVGDIYASTQNLYIAEPKYHSGWWYEESGDEEETYIHKFALDGLSMDYKGVGVVPGTILNQFSMDESGDYFRIATTKGGWWSESTNNLYILDEGLEVVGKVEGLAPGEEIYSVRFVGDRAYMVTFEQIDPLFVIDVGSPTDPKVLGELKIPGVSDYLHPYDENHLIGFGLETVSAELMEELGWSWFQGIKISMFDVTDVSNPVELHKEVIGDRGSYSELSYNHKALLFDKSKGIMAFPITVAEIPQSVKDDLDLDSWIYGTYTFQGAYVYDVSVEDGFVLRGTISHYEEDELGENFDYYYYYGDNKNVERILYIGDYFYTVSPEMVKANEMDSMDEEARVELAE